MAAQRQLLLNTVYIRLYDGLFKPYTLNISKKGIKDDEILETLSHTVLSYTASYTVYQQVMIISVMEL